MCLTNNFTLDKKLDTQTLQIKCLFKKKIPNSYNQDDENKNQHHSKSNAPEY